MYHRIWYYKNPHAEDKDVHRFNYKENMFLTTTLTAEKVDITLDIGKLPKEAFFAELAFP